MSSRTTPLLRPATPDDYTHFARLFPELATGDPLPLREHFEGGIAPSTLMVEDQGLVVAYIYFQILATTGYVRHIVVAPEARGRGIGRLAMQAVADKMREAGCRRWALNVKPDNLPALRLYESLGLARAYRSTALRFDWSLVEALPLPDEPSLARIAAPEDDSTIESSFDLYEGQIANDRERARRILLMLEDPHTRAALGFASFSPEFPGAFPFRLARASLVRPLLEAIRPHALPEFSFMQVVVEAHDELEKALLDRGASLRLEILHLRGAL